MARGLAEAGADLILISRDLPSLEQARDELAVTGRRVEILSVDVGSPEPSEVGAQRVLDNWGPVDILINNVGGRRIDVATESLPTVDWQRIIDLNLTSAFIWSKVVGGAMLPRGWGRVINVASISGLVANRGIAGRSYETSKAALLSFTAPWRPTRLPRCHGQRDCPGGLSHRAEPALVSGTPRTSRNLREHDPDGPVRRVPTNSPWPSILPATPRGT